MFGRLGITFYSVAYLSFFKLLAESLWFNAICSFWKNSRTDNSAATGSCGTWILTPEIGTVDFREAEDTFGMSGSGRLSWTIRGLDVNSANWCRSTAETGYWSALTSTQRSSPSCPPTIIKNRIIFLIQFRTNCLKPGLINLSSLISFSPLLSSIPSVNPKFNNLFNKSFIQVLFNHWIIEVLWKY